jgi:hypothetical protein
MAPNTSGSVKGDEIRFGKELPGGGTESKNSTVLH